MRVLSMILAAAAAVASATVPTFSQQWSAAVVQHTATNQGGQNDGKGNICCPYSSPQCKIQTQYLASKQYFDLPNNRSSAFYSDGSAVITLFSDLKEYEVNSQGVCQSFCPLPDYPMQSFGIPSDATDKGAEKYNGQDAELYTTTSEFPVLNVTMSTMSFYVNGKTNAAPVAFVQQLTPFGQPLGGSTTLFSDWANGAPDASRFVVTGKDTCKEAQNCGGSSGGSSSGSHHKKKDSTSPTPGSNTQHNDQARYLEAVNTPFGYVAPSELRAAAARRASQE